MIHCTTFKTLIFVVSLIFMMCNEVTDFLPTESQYGSISGKVLHPDNDLTILVLSEEGTDTVILDPATQMFTADSIKYGYCLLQVKAEGYLLFEKKIVLDKPQYLCHDIVLAQNPWQIAYLDPSSSQHIDSVFCSVNEPSITDTGFLVCLTFSNDMDTESVNSNLTIFPDTVGVQKIWARLLSLYLFIPYWKLSTIDTLKVSLNRMAKNYPWGDTLGSDFSYFYTVDTSFIRTSKLK